jgi:hypothetical protein
MFSDKFTEIKNYSLVHKKYLDTSSIMPWRYTSVFDSNYKPEISEEVKNKFQLFFYYRLQYAAQILEDDRKYLEITHENNIVKEYRAINPIKLPFFIDSGEWNHFIHTLEISNLDNCRQRIFDYVGESVVMASITSVTYDSNCNATGLYFLHDPSISLNHSELANKLCNASYSINRATPTVYINPLNNQISYNISLPYGARSFRYAKISGKTMFDSSECIPTRIKNQPQTNRVINTLVEHKLITDEMVDYIKEVIPEDTKLEFEYSIDEDGSLIDIIAKNIVIEEFHDVAKENDHPMYDIFEKRNLI